MQLEDASQGALRQVPRRLGDEAVGMKAVATGKDVELPLQQRLVAHGALLIGLDGDEALGQVGSVGTDRVGTARGLVHLVFECPGLGYIRQKYPGLFGQHAGTMVQFIWQADLHWLPSLSQSVWVYIVALTLMGVRHLISPRWLEEM